MNYVHAWKFKYKYEQKYPGTLSATTPTVVRQFCVSVSHLGFTGISVSVDFTHPVRF